MTDHPAGQPGDGEAAAGGSEPATCYRHPEREAHIRCVRCNRRICPDCMVDASVGFQCPECVREGNKGVRRARTVFGGRVTADPGYVSKVLIGINAARLPAPAGRRPGGRPALLADRRPAFDPLLGESVGVADGEVYRLLTAAFLHGSILHLALNMYALFLFGPPLEAALGRVRFTALYLISALGGQRRLLCLQPSRTSPPWVPPGAVFGLLGAFLVLNRRLGRDTSGVLVLLGINLAFGFLAANIDWRAHLGGLFAGRPVRRGPGLRPARSGGRWCRRPAWRPC